MSIQLDTTAPDFEAETGSVSNDEAKEMFGSWEEPKPYIPIVAQPR
jgi:hypothetical protein